MKCLIIILLLALLPDQQKAMLHICGAASMEEIDEETLMRFERFSAHPVDLNNVSRSALAASGLLSGHQISALLDYRSSSGDILSFAELAMIDGFLPEDADALRHFVTLDSSSPPGSRRSLSYDHELRLSATLKHDGSHSGGFRYEGELGDWAELRLSPSSFSAAYYGRRSLGKLVVGSFNARFGQGLLTWSGFSMSGYSSIAAFSRKASGISATTSSLTDNFGIASDWNIGNRGTLALAYSWRSGAAIASYSHVGRNFTLGVNASSSGISADFLIPLPDAGVFGEAACLWNGAPAAVLGTHWTPVYGQKFALLARYYGAVYKEYSGIAIGAELPSWMLSADFAYRVDNEQTQLKALAICRPVFELGLLGLEPQLRFQGRYRPGDGSPLRLELRGVLESSLDAWMLNLRGDLVYCSSLAWLWYLEGGRKTDRYGLYLRGGLFKVDDWDDRIYVYERTAPGGFSVPAYYGRGWSASLYAYWHVNRHHSVYLRLEKTDFPWNLSEKSGKSALKFQYRHRF